MRQEIFKKIRIPVSLLAIILIGLALRMYNLGKFGLWFDEAVCGHALDYLKNIFSASSKTPGTVGISFLVLLKGWSIFGQNDYFLRLLPVLCGIASIIMIYHVGKCIFSERVGIISALLLGISPLHVYYSQELTYYSLSVLLALVSSYYMLKTLERSSLRMSILYVITTVGFIYNHSVNPVLLLAQNMFFYLFYCNERSLRRKWIVLQSIIIFLSLPWLMTVGSQFLRFSKSNMFFWIPQPHVGTFLQTFMTFSLGYYAYRSSQLIALIVLLFFLGWGIFCWRKKKETFYLIFWMVIPAGIIWLISQDHPFYLHRIFLFSIPAFFILIAAGIAVSHKFFRLLFFIPYVVLVVFSLVRYNVNRLPSDYNDRYVAVWPKKDFKGAAFYVSKNFQDGDVILHVCRSSFMPFVFYLDESLPEYGVVLNGICKKDWIRIWNHNELSKVKEGFFKQRTILPIKDKNSLQKYKRVWLIYSSWECTGLTQVSSYEGVGKTIVGWFDTNFAKQDVRMFDGLNVHLFFDTNKNP